MFSSIHLKERRIPKLNSPTY